MLMIYKTFEQLTRDDIYAIAKLRQDVFIVEQNSIYQDLDGLDQNSIHYLINDKNGQLVGYGRYREVESLRKVKIERVVFLSEVRGMGKGEVLLKQMLADISRSYPEYEIVLSSQTYACQFYHRLGFVEFGEPYDDGGIEHIGMLYSQ